LQQFILDSLQVNLNFLLVEHFADYFFGVQLQFWTVFILKPKLELDDVIFHEEQVLVGDIFDEVREESPAISKQT
jgi:hypothetical protein